MVRSIYLYYLCISIILSIISFWPYFALSLNSTQDNIGSNITDKNTIAISKPLKGNIPIPVEDKYSREILSSSFYVLFITICGLVFSIFIPFIVTRYERKKSRKHGFESIKNELNTNLSIINKTLEQRFIQPKNEVNSEIIYYHLDTEAFDSMI